MLFLKRGCIPTPFLWCNSFKQQLKVICYRYGSCNNMIQMLDIRDYEHSSQNLLWNVLQFGSCLCEKRVSERTVMTNTSKMLNLHLYCVQIALSRCFIQQSCCQGTFLYTNHNKMYTKVPFLSKSKNFFMLQSMPNTVIRYLLNMNVFYHCLIKIVQNILHFYFLPQKYFLLSYKLHYLLTMDFTI